MYPSLVALVAVWVAAGGADARMYHETGPYSLTDALLREVVAKMGEANDYLGGVPSDNLIMDDEDDETVNRVAKQFQNSRGRLLPDYDTQETMLRDQEFLQHSSLWGHQYVAGGAGEGKQRLKPDGSMSNVQEVKTDNVLPAYCNPPNPCPNGYTADDGCLEEFVNSAVFSREYQASQECMCDTEHMFDCPTTTRENEINALAQSMQNEGVMDHALDKIMEDIEIQGQHKNMVAKKHHLGTAKHKRNSNHHQSTFSNKNVNPYLLGEKLPIVAKKAPRFM